MTPAETPRPPRRRRDPFGWVITHPGTVDLIVFGGIALLVLLLGVVPGSGGWWLPFTLAMLLSAAVCRVRPGLGVALIGSLALLHMIAGMPVIGGDAVTFYAMFCAIAYGSPGVRWAGIGAGVLGMLIQSVHWGLQAYLDPYGGPAAGLAAFVGLLVTGTIALVAVWALASLQRARQRQLHLIAERAEQAVREREQRTSLAVAEERARIAREMHDVVAHSLSVIIAQADGGRFVAAQQPEQAAQVLTTISDTGRAALADMRSLLGVLRQDEETSYGPQPGPAQLEDLAARVRAAGLRVTLHRDAALDDLSPAQGMAVFRLVQESLTNVLKHAGPHASAAVTLRRHAGMLEIEVLDDGRGSDPASDGQGHGLTGMHERMAVHGGTLRAGPLPGHGFRVLATLPVPEPAIATATAPDPDPDPDPRTA